MNQAIQNQIAIANAGSRPGMIVQRAKHALSMHVVGGHGNHVKSTVNTKSSRSTGSISLS